MPIDAGYGWTEAPTIRWFFIVATALAVPYWMFRLAAREAARALRN